MHAYFQPGRPAYWTWFQHLENVLRGLGISYVDGSAAHLDFVQEATNPTWTALAEAFPDEARWLWRRDVEFLRWQLACCPIRLVLCNGRGVWDPLMSEISGTEQASGMPGRIRWWVGRATLNGRPVELAGWNYPLARPTGLGSAGEVQLGRVLGTALRGIDATAGQ
jgi:hypothetical protein